jgi:signal transduction histidine kinase
MLTNLVGNALEHGAADKPVLLRVDGTMADAIAISVHNQGMIDQESLPALFEPFGGMSVTDRNGGQGLGLGLQIVRHIVGLHGGSIVAENQPPDGVVFQVVLPRAAAA